MKRADILKWSAIASSKRLPMSSSDKHKSICMREIPAIITLERHLLLFGIGSPETEREVAQVCRDLFGIEPSDTINTLPDIYWTLSEYDEKRRQLYKLWLEHELQFETGEDLTDDESAVVLKRFGLDFFDERGQPLRCTKLLSRVAEYSAKGIKGKLPEQSDLQIKKFEDSLTRERDAFLTKKRTQAKQQI